MAINSNLAGVARVAFSAETGEFNRDVDAAERRYRAATGGMSDSAVRLELAQDKLRRALAKGPAASREQARALLQVRQAERELEGQTKQTTAAIDRQQRELSKGARGFGVLRSNLVGLASAFVGTTGVIYGLRSTIEAAKEAETTQGRLAVAVRNAGQDFARHRQEIDRTIQAHSRLSAFDDEELADSFSKLIIRTRDVSNALTATAQVADIARGRQISLESATQLYIKASLGQAGALRRVGIDVDKNAKSQELLNKLTATYAGQAERYANSAAGAQDRLRVSFEESQEVIGRALLPTISRLSGEVADYLDKANRTGEMQRNVNEAVRTGGEVVRGLAGAFRVVKAAVDPAVDALGGVENAVKTLGLLWVGLKVKAIAGFAGTALASRATSAKMIADAAAAGRAWDIATRTRNMIVTTTGGGVPTGGTPTRTGPNRRFPGTTGTRGGGLVGVAGFVAATVVIGDATAPPSLREQQLRVADMSRVDRARATALAREFSREFGTPIAQLTFNNPLLAKYGRPVGPAARTSPGLTSRPDEGTRARPDASTPGAPRDRGGQGGRNRPTGDGLTRFQRLTLTASQAELTADLRDDLAAARDLEAHYARVASNEKLKGDKLFQARQDLLSAQQRTQGIEDQIAADRQQAVEKAAERRRVAAEKRKKAEARARAQAARLAGFGALGAAAGGTGLGMDGIFGAAGVAAGLGATTGTARSTRAAARRDPNAVTLADIGNIMREFRTSFVDLVNRSNVAGGSLQTHVLEQLTREQTSVVRDAFTGPRRRLRSEDEAAFA